MKPERYYVIRRPDPRQPFTTWWAVVDRESKRANLNFGDQLTADSVARRMNAISDQRQQIGGAS